ncbi:unnamed protein product [Auanema sp. JU1783]|nr:unnamed protein product [Auanema sp. JU1783]
MSSEINMHAAHHNQGSLTRQDFINWTANFIKRRSQRNCNSKLAARKVRLAREKARLRLRKSEVDREFERLHNKLYETAQQLRNDNKILKATFLEMASKCNRLNIETKSIRMSLEREIIARDRVVPDCDEIDIDRCVHNFVRYCHVANCDCHSNTNLIQVLRVILNAFP